MIVILLYLIMPNYPEIGPSAYIPVKRCFENMHHIQHATMMYYIENPPKPNTPGVTIDFLMKNNYLKELPKCSLITDESTQEAYYKIIDNPGQTIDVECINTRRPNFAHGSYIKLTRIK